MRRCRVFLFVIALCLSLVQLTLAQRSAQTSGEIGSALPRLVRFGGTVKGSDGNPLTGVAGITFALYSEQTGGAPLWMETQNVTADSNGHYTALLGSTKHEGLPVDLFNSEQARWVGVQVQGQAEQPRVLLVSAPYALKAGDAETIGGLPPSAFVLAAPPSSGPATASGPAAIAAGSRDVSPTAATDVTTTGGTANYLPFFTGAATILDSVVYQTGTGATARIGINTAAPTSKLDVNGATTLGGPTTLPATGTATSTAGNDSEPLNLVASAFNTTAAVNQTFQLQAEPAGNDTATPSGTLNLLFGAGTATPAETGLSIANNGQITFASGQTFPGAGTITGITTATGSGLTGGSTSGTLSLGLLTTCAANQVLGWNGSAWACATVGGGGSGTVTSVATGLGLLGGPITTSGTLAIDTTLIPQLGAATNTFTGNITAGTVNATTSFEIQGYLFGYGSPFIGSGQGNSFLGFAGNQTMTGLGNVGAGWAALLSNTTGEYNTAVGLGALQSNTQGVNNTAVGQSALFANGQAATPSNASGNTAVGYGAAYGNTGGYVNTALGDSALYNNTTGDYNTAAGGSALWGNSTGNYNTAVGYFAGPNAGNLSNTTAIGNFAAVGESNALVLGGTGPNAVNVGIGTATPQYTLDVHGTGNFTGNVTFASTQTFPGAGSISDVVAGTGLTGGGTGTNGSVTLSVNPALIPQLGAANTFTGNQNVNGDIVATSSTIGVLGESNATSGPTYGVGGLGQSPSGYGVEGLNIATSGGAGVYGSSASSTGYGVEGVITASSGGAGVYGAAPHFGLQGVATGGAGSVGVYGSGGDGVYGATTSPTGYGVYGVQYATTGTTAGVYGKTSSASGYGVYGTAPAFGLMGVATGSGSGNAIGVSGTGATGLQGTGTAYGVSGTGTTGLLGTGTAYGVSGFGTATGSTGVDGSGGTYGVSGTGTAAGSTGVYGTGPGYGLYGLGTGNGAGIAAYGSGGGSGGEFYGGSNDSLSEGGPGATFQGGDGEEAGGAGLIATGGNNGTNANDAGVFYGDIYVTGSSVSVRDELKIDHPLDPANKYLLHASVESSETMNIYSGNVTTDDGGLATVQLPEWFEAINKDFRYQLTVIGQFAQAIVSGKVASHQFGIQTDKPNVEVSWQITGIRQDAYATAHPLVVEQEKDARERGHYIHPELYGAPEQQSIQCARYPEVMKRMQQNRARQLAAAQKPATTTLADPPPIVPPSAPR
jgi:hypothetical protein